MTHDPCIADHGSEAQAEETPSAALTAWTRLTTCVRPAVPEAQGHVIHSYFNTSPESPDGRFILFFQATTPDAHHGHVVILDRVTGEQHLLERDIEAEDGHRVAYQQWSCGGRKVVFHTLREGRWQVIAVDVRTFEKAVLAEGRQLGFGDPAGSLVPLHGLHWSPGNNRDLELLDVETGDIQTAVPIEQLQEAYPTRIAELYGDRPVSIFFPVLGPPVAGDGRRVMFKLASPDDGTFRSKSASRRHALIVYDLHDRRFLYFQSAWCHPSWCRDGRTILNVPNTLLDTDTGTLSDIPGLPRFPGSHPTPSPAGRVFATDTHNQATEPHNLRWAIALCDIAGHHHHILHRFHATPVTSWRPPHPHPAFSHDGERLYFNASDEQLTQLYVAEHSD